MKIIGCELYTVSLPTRRKHTWATSTKDVGLDYTVARIWTDDGVEGWGEASSMPEWGGDHDHYYGETATTLQAVIREHLMPAVEGMDPFDIDLIHRKMDLAIRGYPYAKAVVDLALYDIMGKAVNRPVYQLLGGRNRDRIPLAHSLGIMPVDAAVAEAVEAVGEGIRHIKIKGGLDHNRDMALVGKLRAELGPDITLLVDANQGYRTAKEAIKWITKMDDAYNLEYVEQPVEGLEPMALTRSMLKLPVCADESCWSLADALEVIRRGAADYISIYTGKPGGLYGGRVIARAAEAAGMLCNVNGSGEFGIGNAANLHLASTGRNIALPSVFPVTCLKGKEQTKVACRWFTDDIIKKAFDYDEGCLKVPEGPGLGVEIDPEKLKQYGKKESC